MITSAPYRRDAFLILAMLGFASSAGALERVPVPDPVRACPRYGAGFVEVPGTSTCIRIGGRVASEYGGATRRVSRDEIAGFGAKAQVSVETRTDTAYGPLKSFVRVRAGSLTGPGRD